MSIKSRVIYFHLHIPWNSFVSYFSCYTPFFWLFDMNYSNLAALRLSGPNSEQKYQAESVRKEVNIK